MTPEHDNKQDRYRKIYAKTTGEHASATRDRYAKFMAERFPDATESYAEQWANRFSSGSHWHSMDKKSKIAMLKTMTETTGATAQELTANDLTKAAEEVKK